MKLRILALAFILAGCAGSTPAQTRSTLCGAVHAACALATSYCAAAPAAETDAP